jgi:hypothetical protein
MYRMQEYAKESKTAPNRQPQMNQNIRGVLWNAYEVFPAVVKK